MNMNFFEWLRNGVRQSVILGVSDAVEQIGVPDESEANPTLAALLGTDTSSTTKPRRKSNSTAGRKRLGKSLKEMNPSK